MVAEILYSQYEASDSITLQGNREKIKKYLKNGYYVEDERNGFWILKKPVRVLITLGSSEIKKTYNMKSDILDYYGKNRISKKIYEKFIEDVQDGKIKILMDSEGSYTIK